ncbi:uncharacterized protein [Temnothorax longispinosus]|uniref:uncharacterized protein n=1 Tax=Temnothorax longispinosus TaxID=300112 RepID=UPI003A99219E
MSDAKEVKIPIEHEWDAYDSKHTDSSVPYREAVGNLTFLQVVSRPDIAFALNVASRALDNPTKAHWNLVKRIIRYVKGTTDYGIVYGANNQFKTFSDADYAGDKETRKSTTGVVCMYGGAAISWQSTKQQCVAVSTTEAEYVSAAAAARKNVWVMRLLRELDVSVSENILYIDNQSALRLVKNPEFHKRSKHIDVKYHFVRDLYEKGEINVCYVKTEEQLADIFTKVLNVKRF